MDTVIKSWEGWLVHHPRAARKLMAELPVPCKILTPVGESVNISASAFVGNAYLMGRLADTMVTREFSERMLRALGYSLRDEICDELVMLQIRNPKVGPEFIGQFPGLWRWKEALRFALEYWEKTDGAK